MRARHQFLGLVVCERYLIDIGAIPGYGIFGSTSTEALPLPELLAVPLLLSET